MSVGINLLVNVKGRIYSQLKQSLNLLNILENMLNQKCIRIFPPNNLIVAVGHKHGVNRSDRNCVLVL